MDAAGQLLRELCRDVLRPLIEADEGELYLVSVADDQIALHLGGACSGCPGVSLTVQTLIEPAVRAVHPSARVVVTVGAKHPAHAVLVKAEVDADVGANVEAEAGAIRSQLEP